MWFLFVYSPIKLSKRRIKFDQHFPITLHQAVHNARVSPSSCSSPPLRPFVCNSGSSFDCRLLHAYDWLYDRRCHPSPVGRAFDFIACHSAIATHVATTMSACHDVGIRATSPHAYSSVILSSLNVYSWLRLFMLSEPRGILLKLHINASLSLQSSISVSDTI